MPMTRQHFAALASAVQSVPMSDAARATLAGRLAATLADFNPRFDRDRFVAACSPPTTLQHDALPTPKPRATRKGSPV